ncbi:MAG: hypothetical protein P4L66_08110 [Acetobacteraceae bacterium]|nr:hypothetical protein [Acetobacteraceae bacterium]
MAPEGSLKFVLDENTASVATLLRLSRAEAVDRIRTLPELDINPGTLDPALLRQLGERGPHVLISRDSRILHSLVQRGAWKEARVTLFLLEGKWGRLPLGEMARRLLYLWPYIIQQAESGPLGNAWRVAAGIPTPGGSTFRLVTGLHAGTKPDEG